LLPQVLTLDASGKRGRHAKPHDAFAATAAPIPSVSASVATAKRASMIAAFATHASVATSGDRGGLLTRSASGQVDGNQVSAGFAASAGASD